MIIAIIIIAYVANVFLNRWLNKYTNKKYFHQKEEEKWFSSIFGTRYFLIKIIRRRKSDWFNGKYW